MKRLVFVRTAIQLGVVATFILCTTAAAQAQIWAGPLPSTTPKKPAAPGPQVIHVHHHYHYPVQGAYSPLIAAQGEPEFDEDILAGPPEKDYEPRPWEKNWGDMGFHAYLGQQGDYTGLIVENVTPDSPAAQLGLNSDDIILTVNEQDMAELNYNDINKLFTELTGRPKVEITVVVWNMKTNRTSTLQAVLETDPQKEVDNPATE